MAGEAKEQVREQDREKAVAGILLELRPLRQWVVWRYEWDGKRYKKRPYLPGSGQYASPTDPTTWGSYKQAVDSMQADGYDGIGFVLTAGDPFCGVDLDDCRDPATGEIEPYATNIVRELNSYTEISPSGEGLRIIVMGSVPTARKRQGVEITATGGYITITGRHISGVLCERQTELSALYERYFGQEDEEGDRLVSQDSFSDASSVFEVAEKLSEDPLFCGQWEGRYPSQSEADQALCNRIARMTADPAAIDSVFRQSELYRDDKWGKRPDYRERTIRNALARAPRNAALHPQEEGRGRQHAVVSSAIENVAWKGKAGQSQYKVMHAIASELDADFRAEISQRQISERAGISSFSTTNGAIASLRKSGYIETTRGRHSTVYTVSLPALEASATAAPATRTPSPHGGGVQDTDCANPEHYLASATDLGGGETPTVKRNVAAALTRLMHSSAGVTRLGVRNGRVLTALLERGGGATDRELRDAVGELEYPRDARRAFEALSGFSLVETARGGTMAVVRSDFLEKLYDAIAEGLENESAQIERCRHELQRLQYRKAKGHGVSEREIKAAQRDLHGAKLRYMQVKEELYG